ncbi:hypothetical protein A3709_20610 [Halioglobus sp. HI00S01]|uniref:hypothetical protein n=1 Tax=Halioglobus sp. HI00S01 TaxID=1822214 RepID=UPI0007C3F9F2|nr:hypothetical protein [Halioglobus sp. HI00S01]KZX58016.1 hypothetical protein A3709_20610 [Halioglobus sp. HI00S01]
MKASGSGGREGKLEIFVAEDTQNGSYPQAFCCLKKAKAEVARQLALLRSGFDHMEFDDLDEGPDALDPRWKDSGGGAFLATVNYFDHIEGSHARWTARIRTHFLEEL